MTRDGPKSGCVYGQLAGGEPRMSSACTALEADDGSDEVGLQSSLIETAVVVVVVVWKSWGKECFKRPLIGRVEDEGRETRL